MSIVSPEILAERLVTGSFHRPDMIESLTEMARRGETSHEVAALATAFRRAAVPVRTAHPIVLDMCGTGGARFRTFNVSTIASFVVASLGIPVAKHGNRSNRGCGSADVLESLGARISLAPEEASRALDRIGFAFLYAPAFHPAMRHAAPVRKEISTRTVFNMLGPLLNPVVAPRRQLIGVYSPKLLDILPPVLPEMGVQRALLVHGRPGMDEVSVIGSTEAVLVDGDRYERFLIDPREMGLDSRSAGRSSGCGRSSGLTVLSGTSRSNESASQQVEGASCVAKSRAGELRFQGRVVEVKAG